MATSEQNLHIDGFRPSGSDPDNPDTDLRPDRAIS